MCEEKLWSFVLAAKDLQTFSKEWSSFAVLLSFQVFRMNCDKFSKYSVPVETVVWFLSKNF
jgi:hypothetical protein